MPAVTTLPVPHIAAAVLTAAVLVAFQPAGAAPSTGASAGAAALKKEACLRHIAEYFRAESGSTSLRESLGGFAEGDANEIIDKAGTMARDPGKLRDFLGRLKAEEQLLEEILPRLNGIADNESIEARNEAFSKTNELAGQIAGRMPAMGEFLSYHAGAFDDAVKAFNELGNQTVGVYKPMVDDYIDRTPRLQCCTHDYSALNETSMQETIGWAWANFQRNRLGNTRAGLRSTVEGLDRYFSARLKIKWIQCCVDYALRGK